jgi:hypothetical protein
VMRRRKANQDHSVNATSNMLADCLKGGAHV